MAPILHQLFENEDEKTLPTIITKKPTIMTNDVVQKVTRFYYQFPLAAKTKSQPFQTISIALLSLTLIAVLIILSISLRKVEESKSEQQSSLKSSIENNAECFSPNCLSTAAYILSNLDEKQDACDSFYNFTCGKYAKNYQYAESEFGSVRSPLDLMETGNYNFLKEILSGKFTNIKHADSVSGETNSGIEKAAIFYGTCMNSGWSLFQTNPVDDLFAYIKSQFGGWVPVLNYKSEPGKQLTKENIVDIMAKLGQINIWNIFNVEIRPSASVLNVSQLATYKNPYILQITCSGCNSIKNFDKPFISMDNTSMGKIFRTVIQNLQNDAGLEMNSNISDVADRAVKDILFVDNEIRTTISWLLTQNVTAGTEIRTLNWLNKAVPNFNWIEYASTIFGPDAQITGDMLILSPHTEFLKEVMDLILFRLSDEQLNTYLIMKVITSFLGQLGAKYSETNSSFRMHMFLRQLNFDYMSGWNNLEKACFYRTADYFEYAIADLFIRNAFSDMHMAKVIRMYGLIRDAVAKRVRSLEWMDDETKSAAIQNIFNTETIFGYTKWLKDENKVDNFYAAASVSTQSRFNNTLNMRIFKTQRDAINLLTNESLVAKNGPFEIYRTTFYYRPPRSESPEKDGLLFFPVGIMQPPMFHPDLPAYVNFAGLGRLIASKLFEIIDDNDRGIYWSTSTQRNFKENITNCHINRAIESSPRTKHSNLSIQYIVRSQWIESAALKVAYEAYLNYVQLAPTENKPLPGFSNSDISLDQMFLIAYGQTFCHAGSELAVRFRTIPFGGYLSSSIPGETVLYPVLEDFTQFSQNFRCSDSSRYAQPSRCIGF